MPENKQIFEQVSRKSLAWLFRPAIAKVSYWNKGSVVSYTFCVGSDMLCFDVCLRIGRGYLVDSRKFFI